MDEYISREEAKRFFNLNFGGVSHAIIASRLLDEIPAADVAPVRHGWWNESRPVLRRVNRTNIPVVECSVCGIIFCDLINNHRFMYHFCPHCGARMDGD